MPRRPSLPSKNVNLRMPEDLLKQMDCLAQTRQHGRTSEINCACRYWIETSGHAMDTPLDSEIGNLKAEIVELEGKIQRMHQEIGEQNQVITTLTSELKIERLAMLDIMAKDKAIIDRLCADVLEQRKETQVLGMGMTKGGEFSCKNSNHAQNRK